MVYLPDGDTDFFDIVSSILQGDTLAAYLFVTCLDYVLWTSIDLIKENGFTWNRRYLAETITDADDSDDLALLANTPTQTKSLLHSLKLAAEGIGSYVNKKSRLHPKWQSSKISRPVHISQQQYLIYWK